MQGFERDVIAKTGLPMPEERAGQGEAVAVKMATRKAVAAARKKPAPAGEKKLGRPRKAVAVNAKQAGAGVAPAMDKRRGRQPYKLLVDGKLYCSDCEKWKVIDDFAFAKNKPHSRATYCKACMNARLNEWRSRSKKNGAAHNEMIIEALRDMKACNERLTDVMRGVEAALGNLRLL
jgi:hypothetical protein